MARSVSDIAVALSVMTGVDSAERATNKKRGQIEEDLPTFLKQGSLQRSAHRRKP